MYCSCLSYNLVVNWRLPSRMRLLCEYRFCWWGCLQGSYVQFHRNWNWCQSIANSLAYIGRQCPRLEKERHHNGVYSVFDRSILEICHTNTITQCIQCSVEFTVFLIGPSSKYVIPILSHNASSVAWFFSCSLTSVVGPDVIYMIKWRPLMKSMCHTCVNNL